MQGKVKRRQLCQLFIVNSIAPTTVQYGNPQAILALSTCFVQPAQMVEDDLRDATRIEMVVEYRDFHEGELSNAD